MLKSSKSKIKCKNGKMHKLIIHSKLKHTCLESAGGQTSAAPNLS